MKLTLRASTAAKIVVWQEGDLYFARLADSAERPAECLAIDLFEVIAELAGLDLERGKQAAEALELAEMARRRLAGVDALTEPWAPISYESEDGDGHEDEDEDEDGDDDDQSRWYATRDG